MHFNEFTLIVEEIKSKNPIWFQLDSDPPATDSEISSVEKDLSVILPEEYKIFCKEFGGGYFAFTNIYSVTNSEWNIVQKNKGLGLIKSFNFIAISDNETGDFYGYKFLDGICSSKIMVYDHEFNEITKVYNDLYEFLLQKGLRQNS